MPCTTDRKELTEYLGKNHKSLFINQQSGFDAEFDGRCTNVDPDTGLSLSVLRRLEKNERCYVVFKDVETDVSADKVVGASVLVINPDYTWESVSDEETRSYYYPSRLFRTSRYNYIQSGI